MALYYPISIFALVITFGVFILIKNKSDKVKSLTSKIVAVITILLFVTRYIWQSFAIRETVGLTISSPFGPTEPFKTAISFLVIWFVFPAQISLTTYFFFKDRVKSLNTIVKYFSLCVYLIAFVSMPWVSVAMDGRGAGFSARGVVYAIEVGVSIALAFTVLLKDYKFNLKGWREILCCVFALLGMLLITMPSYTIPLFYGRGEAGKIIDDFNLTHRLLLYGAFIMPIALHFIFRQFNYEKRRYALLYISIATLITYCNKYSYTVFADLRAWPLHLCNTAMFIVPLCLAFKWGKLYYFTLFINVLGALLAMLFPTATTNLSEGTISFWLNHYCAFFMPILMMSLKIFERPKIKQFTWSLIAFAIYYLLVLVLNAYLTAEDPTRPTDFFFINSNFIAEKLGTWAEDIFKNETILSVAGLELVFYPIYQTLYFFVYVLLSFAMWFVYEEFFTITDTYGIMLERNKKIKMDLLALQVQMGGRSLKEPMNLDGQNKLILKNFSKRYSNSDVYAVKDANLEIEGGQIFGFLGPNGAGKSTIIKSIVGIQSITSGAIEVCGYDVEKQPIGAKMNIGFVPDHYALYENLTGREYINYIADLYNVSKEDRTKRIDEYVSRFRLNVAFDNHIKTYSHGMKQKITIMSALVHNPKLWILDEPLTGLDPESIFQVKECMKHHAENGNIVFFSSHIIDVVERIC
ncbi:MAG: YwaF family protein, partial [Clostridia bacterium]|nr:YwaF family protein [Clostridia bacterium]